VAYWFTSLAREIVTSAARAHQCARPDKQKATIGGETMNKFLLAWIVIFMVWFGGRFVAHGVLLHDDYARLQTTGLFRTEAESQQFFPLMILAYVMLPGLASITAFMYRQPARI
jgi:hypothetical protein